MSDAEDAQAVAVSRRYAGSVTWIGRSYPSHSALLPGPVSRSAGRKTRFHYKWMYKCLLATLSAALAGVVRLYTESLLPERRQVRKGSTNRTLQKSGR